MQLSPLIADNEILVALWSYWTAKRGDRAMPRRGEIDPVDVPRLLPYLQLIERDDAGRFRFRLTGTAIVDLYGRDLTGQHVDGALPPHRTRTAERHFATAFESRRPLFAMTRYTTPRGYELIIKRIILPLSEDGVHVNMLLIGNAFEHRHEIIQRLNMSAIASADSDVIDFLA
jgi:hypothetical protein